MPKYVVTASLRETVKDMFKAGKSQSQICKLTCLHHYIVRRIRNGAYDHLRDKIRSIQRE